MKQLSFLLILIFIFSCTKENNQLPATTSNLLTLSTATITMPVYPTLTYLKAYPGAPVRYTSDISGYLIPTSVIGTQVYVLYNRLNKRTSKLWYRELKRPDGGWRNQLYALNGTLAFSIDVLKRIGKPDTGYNVKIGSLPYFDLGYYTVNLPRVVKCSRNQGFNACYVCARNECHDTWYCDFACVLAHGACQAGWIAACAILNPPKNPFGGGYPMADTTQKQIIKIPWFPPADLTL